MPGGPALYHSAAGLPRRAGSGRTLGQLLLLLLLGLLLQLPLLRPERLPTRPVVRQRRGSLAAPHPVPLGTRRAARPKPKLPRKGGRVSSGCGDPAGGAQGNFGEASSGSGSGNDSLARARRAPGQLESRGLGRRGVHMLAQPPPGRLLQL